jgi:hypothetical protein
MIWKGLLRYSFFLTQSQKNLKYFFSNKCYLSVPVEAFSLFNRHQPILSVYTIQDDGNEDNMHYTPISHHYLMVNTNTKHSIP